MSRVLLSLAMLFCLPLLMAAQSERGHVLRGVVLDSADSRPISGVVVQFVPEGQEGSGYAFTDARGCFELSLGAAPAAGDSLLVSMMGYGTMALGSAEMSQEMRIFLVQKAFDLREVVVRAPKVDLSGDTVSYNVQSFVEQQDKSISDVLRRMPGVEVKTDGTISYNGESIGNLYVEGMDIVGGRYTLLTENISAKDIKKVEIVERHQPVKALKGISAGEKPAINLILQDNVRGRWVGNTTLAGGVSSAPSALWDGSLFLMRVGRGVHSVNSLKTNNTGKDLTGGLSGLSMFDRQAGNEGFVSVGTGNAPLETQRVRFNTSAMANTSNTWNMGNDKDWTANISAAYLLDRLEAGNSSRTTYYFEDREMTVDESEEAQSTRHLLQARLEVTGNKEEYFFKNILKAEGVMADASQTMTGEYPNTQQARMPYLSVIEDLKYVHRSGNLAWSVISNNDLGWQDQRLTVLRDGGTLQDSMQRQSVALLDFNTHTYASTDFRVARNMTIGLRGGIMASVRTLESRLEGVDTAGLGLSGANFENDLTVAILQPYLSPNMEYIAKNWEVRMSLPVSWANYWGPDTRHLVWQASGSVRYKPVPRISLTVSGNASNSTLNIRDYYTGYILRNYRYMTVGSTNTEPDRSYTASASLNYKDPVRMFYADASVSRSWNILQTTSTQNFLGDYIVTGTGYSPSRGDSWYASISCSIGIYRLNGKLNLFLSYTDFSSTSMMQDGVRTPYLSQTISFRPTFYGRLTRWLSLDYRLDYSHYILSLPGTGTSSAKDYLSQTLSLVLTPFKSLDIKLSADHYHTMLTETQRKNTVLVDASLAYRLKNGMELSLTARNLLNQHTYAYSVFDALQEFSCEYRIRPLNIIASLYFSF